MYLTSVLINLSIFLWLVFIGLIIFVISQLVNMSCEYGARKLQYIKNIKKALIAALIVMGINVLIPCEKTLYKMNGIPYKPKTCEQEYNDDN